MYQICGSTSHGGSFVEDMTNGRAGSDTNGPVQHQCKRIWLISLARQTQWECPCDEQGETFDNIETMCESSLSEVDWSAMLWETGNDLRSFEELRGTSNQGLVSEKNFSVPSSWVAEGGRGGTRLIPKLLFAVSTVMLSFLCADTDHLPSFVT